MPYNLILERGVGITRETKPGKVLVKMLAEGALENFGRAFLDEAKFARRVFQKCQNRHLERIWK